MKLSKYGPNVRAEGKITLQGVGVGWYGVGGGRVTILTNCNSRCFLTFLILLFFCILLFFETIKEIPQWKINFRLSKLAHRIFLLYWQNKRTYSQIQIFRTTIEWRYIIATRRLSIKTGLQERGRNARNIWQNSPQFVATLHRMFRHIPRSITFSRSHPNFPEFCGPLLYFGF